jgi:hypothetical protein
MSRDLSQEDDQPGYGEWRVDGIRLAFAGILYTAVITVAGRDCCAHHQRLVGSRALRRRVRRPVRARLVRRAERRPQAQT